MNQYHMDPKFKEELIEKEKDTRESQTERALVLKPTKETPFYVLGLMLDD